MYIIKEGASAYNYDKMRLSYDDFLKITKDNQNRYEYIDGKIYHLTSPSIMHQKISGNIYTILSLWFKNKKCLPLFSPLDVTLSKGNDKNVVQPDILVICDPENVDENEKYIGILELVIEVLSKSTKSHDLIRKLDLYKDSGVSEYWIINPDSEEIYLYNFRNNEIKDMCAYKNKESVRSTVFERLKIELEEIFG